MALAQGCRVSEETLPAVKRGGGEIEDQKIPSQPGLGQCFYFIFYL